MNKSYNFKKRVGGAEGWGDSTMGSPKEKKKEHCPSISQHKWMTKRTSRTCRLCGFHQYLISKEKIVNLLGRPTNFGKYSNVGTYSTDRPPGYTEGGAL